MCGVGGDLFALVQRADGETLAINSSGRSPPEPTRGAPRPRTRCRSAVPSRSRCRARSPGGTRSTPPGRSPVGRRVRARDRARATASRSPLARRDLAEPDAPFAADPGLAAIFYPDGNARRPARPSASPRWAQRLDGDRADGPAALYGGSLGTAYVAGLHAAGSPITIEDLAAHDASVLPPLRAAFRDLHVTVVPPNSQGFVLLQILALLERLGIDPDPDGPDAGAIARVIDAAARDRDRHLADPDRMIVHPSTLLDDGHLAGLADEIRLERPAPLGHADGDTIALVTADAEGNAVSLDPEPVLGVRGGHLRTGDRDRRAEPRRVLHARAGSPEQLRTRAPGAHLDAGARARRARCRRGRRHDGRLPAAPDQRSRHRPDLVGGATPADAVAAPRWVVLGGAEAGIAGADRLEAERPGGGAAVADRRAYPAAAVLDGRRVRARPPDPDAPRRVRCGLRPSGGRRLRWPAERTTPFGCWRPARARLSRLRLETDAASSDDPSGSELRARAEPDGRPRRHRLGGGRGLDDVHVRLRRSRARSSATTPRSGWPTRASGATTSTPRTDNARSDGSCASRRRAAASTRSTGSSPRTGTGSGSATSATPSRTSTARRP